MPELPEVETVRRGLAPVLVGRRLIRAVPRRADLRFPLPPDFQRRICGRRVEAIDRRAKFLLIRLEGDRILIAHLGMSGRFKVDPGEAPTLDPHDHVILETDEGVTIRFCDPRRFGFMDLVAARDLAIHPMLIGLGPEPCSDDFDGRYLSSRLAGRTAPVKPVLLDQRVVAGMGNIYASESLHRAGLSPKRIAGTVTSRRADRLVQAIKAVFAEAIGVGGSSLRDHRQPLGELGCFQHQLAVYGRAGEACPSCDCGPARGGGIRHLVQAGRSTFYCAKHQR